MKIVDSRPIFARLEDCLSEIDGGSRVIMFQPERAEALISALLRRRAALAAWDRAVANFRRPAFERYKTEIEAASLTALEELGVRRPATTESVAWGF